MPLRVATVICGTLVNTQAHRETTFDRYYTVSSASWAKRTVLCVDSPGGRMFHESPISPILSL